MFLTNILKIKKLQVSQSFKFSKVSNLSLVVFFEGSNI